MQYMGGKTHIAKQVAQHLSPTFGGGGENCFISLFCGSCAVESKVKGFSSITCNDRHPYLIALLNAVKSGWQPPDTVSEDEYRFIRQNKDLHPALTGFVGFGCSFGGKWFGGYARDKYGRNYAAQASQSLLADMVALMGATFICSDYRSVKIPPGAVVYADPPYANTAGYSGEKFDSDEFWICARLIAETGHKIFVSEQQAPPGWVAVWEKPFTRTLDRNKSNQFQITEKLFTWSGTDEQT